MPYFQNMKTNENAENAIKKMLGFIENEDGIIMISTYLKAWQVDKKVIRKFSKLNASLFKAINGEIYMARGKSWDCLTGTKYNAYS